MRFPIDAVFLGAARRRARRRRGRSCPSIAGCGVDRARAAGPWRARGPRAARRDDRRGRGRPVGDLVAPGAAADAGRARSRRVSRSAARAGHHRPRWPALRRLDRRAPSISPSRRRAPGCGARGPAAVRRVRAGARRPARPARRDADRAAGRPPGAAPPARLVRAVRRPGPGRAARSSSTPASDGSPSRSARPSRVAGRASGPAPTSSCRCPSTPTASGGAATTRPPHRRGRGARPRPAVRPRLERAPRDDRPVRARARRAGGQRRRRVRGRGPRASAAGRVRGRWVLLVDDVVTTGATLAACARRARRAGAGRVGDRRRARALTVGGRRAA